jgi:hypothetical protein
VTNPLQTTMRGLGFRIIAGGLLAAATLVGLAGCTVHVEPDHPRYYYRTRVVYTASGPVYVRERVYYDPYYQPAPVYSAPPPTYSPPPAQAPAPAPAAESPAAAQLHPLVAPIALYPDPLVAVLLPATTYPQQLQDASAWLLAYPQPSQAMIDAQPWDPSVKAMVHYPTVLAQLTRDMSWTNSLGSAYINQPADVMAAIQQLRAEALAMGNLVDTPQQVIVQDGGTISIQPANPEVVYVPEYDPVVVYESYHPVYFTTVAYSTGPWLVYGCYWGGGVIFVGDWHGGYYYREGHWHRDYAWHVDRGRYWARDARWGPPPRVDRYHYAMARDVRGREAEIHRSMVQHEPQRREVERRDMHAGGARDAHPGSGHPGH